MTFQSPSRGIFQLQDSLANSIVESFCRSHRPIRPNQPRRDGQPRGVRGLSARQPDSARFEAVENGPDLYLRCVDRDPGSHLRGRGSDGVTGCSASLTTLRRRRRIYDLGVSALRRALDVNPDLSLAHNLYTVEVDRGARPGSRIQGLLERVRMATSEPELFAGLVHTCRYCGLLDASIAACERARSLDPAVVTSVAQTFFLQGRWDQAIAADRSDPPFTTAVSLVQLGRVSEGLQLLRTAAARGVHPLHYPHGGDDCLVHQRYDDVIVHTPKG